MRYALIALTAALAFAPLPALAYENFIPLGQNYSPEQSELPPINSEQARINSQLDIFESEIYNRQRSAKEFSSQLQRFSNDQELRGSSDFIDY